MDGGFTGGWMPLAIARGRYQTAIHYCCGASSEDSRRRTSSGLGPQVPDLVVRRLTLCGRLARRVSCSALLGGGRDGGSDDQGRRGGEQSDRDEDCVDGGALEGEARDREPAEDRGN